MILDYAVRESHVGQTLDTLLSEALQAERKATKDVRISGPSDVFTYCRSMARLKTERLVGLYLSSQNTVLSKVVISKGTLNTTRSHPREILKPALDAQCLGFILVHNHPSGTLVPSSDDIEFTHAIGRAADLMGMPLYDHVIVSSQGFVSLKEKGLL